MVDVQDRVFYRGGSLVADNIVRDPVLKRVYRVLEEWRARQRSQAITSIGHADARHRRSGQEFCVNDSSAGCRPSAR